MSNPTIEAPDRPAFEIHGDGEQIWRIWADGRIDGFPAAGRLLVVNRIQILISQAQIEGAEKAMDGHVCAENVMP